MGCMQEKPAVHIKCPYCGYDDTTMNNKPGQLPIWTFINNSYMIGKSLGDGGFGITYMGFDVNLQKKIAIKEYFPDGFAMRGSDGFTVYPNAAETQAFFEGEKARFVEEARILAQIEEQPGVVKVISFQVENNTAYIIMEFLEGTSLKKYVAEKGNHLSVPETLAIMKPVVKALAGIHEKGVVHRDISLDNIMITKNGKVKLIDFGAAHDHSSVGELRVFKPYYSPIEQRDPNGVIDTYSDIYALCVCFYTVIMGRYPTDASQRFANDLLPKPSQMGVMIDPLIEAAIMKGLEFQPNSRIKNATDLYYFLYVYGQEKNASVAGMEKKIHESSTRVIIEKMKQEQLKSKYKKRNLILVFGILGLGILILASRVAIQYVVDQKENTPKVVSNDSSYESGQELKAEEDLSVCRQDFYDLALVRHTGQPFQVESEYELAATDFITKCVNSSFASDELWNQAMVSFGNEALTDHVLSDVGWVAITFHEDFSIEDVYEEASRQLAYINASIENAIDLTNCTKLGVAVGVHSDGTYFWMFIYQ